MFLFRSDYFYFEVFFVFSMIYLHSVEWLWINRLSELIDCSHFNFSRSGLYSLLSSLIVEKCFFLLNPCEWKWMAHFLTNDAITWFCCRLRILLIESKVEGVVNVHELHVWQLSDTKLIASVHILFPLNHPHFNSALASIQQILHACGIHSTTIQPEFDIDREVSACGFNYSSM